MTIISHTHKYVFLKTRKTAGTSIQASLFEYCRPGDVVTRAWQNLVDDTPCKIEEFATIDEVATHFGAECREYFKFGFVRNPYDLVLSRYFYQIKTNRIAGPPSRDDFNTWLQNIYFVGEPGFPGGRYLKDISRLLLFDNDLNSVVDFIGRFETLSADFKQISARIGLPFATLAHENISNHKRVNYRDWLDSKSIDAVGTYFKFELDYFGYDY